MGCKTKARAGALKVEQWPRNPQSASPQRHGESLDSTQATSATLGCLCRVPARPPFQRFHYPLKTRKRENWKPAAGVHFRHLK